MPADGADQGWLASIGFQLAPQVLDVHPYQGRITRARWIVPYLLEQPFTGEYFAGVAHQMMQELEFNGSEQDGSLVDGSFKGATVK